MMQWIKFYDHKMAPIKSFNTIFGPMGTKIILID